MAKKTRRKRLPMPEHIYSIHQLRDFIRHRDDLIDAPETVTRERRVNYNSLVYRLRKKLNVTDLDDLDDEIRRVVAAFDSLQYACQMKKGTTVKLGSTHLLSVRLVPSLIKAYRQAMAQFDESNFPKIELVYDMHYRKKKEREYYAAPDLSLTYRSRETEAVEGSELLRKSGHHRCIITRNDNSFADLKERIEGGDFRWDDLRGKTVAILPRDAGIPNFPYDSVAGNAKCLLVRAVIEAHEHVRAGNADIAFTHIDPLDKNELRDFTVIRLSHLAEFGQTRLCLLRRKAAHSPDKEIAVRTLSRIAMEYLDQIEHRHQESARLTKAFNKYRYAYYTSCVRDDSHGLVERRWLRGTFRFEVFVSHVTFDKQPVWFIKAIHTGRGHREPQQRVSMFGQVRSTQATGRMTWFASYRGSQQGSVRITFSHDHLNGDGYDFIEGVLTSHPSWLSADDAFDVAGGLFLHKSPNLSDEELNDLLARMRTRSKRLFPSAVNPFNPWELPGR